MRRCDSDCRAVGALSEGERAGGALRSGARCRCACPGRDGGAASRHIGGGNDPLASCAFGGKKGTAGGGVGCGRATRGAVPGFAARTGSARGPRPAVAEAVRRAMTVRLARRGATGAAGLATAGCSETRIGLLEPIGTNDTPNRLAEAGADSGDGGADGLLIAACARWSAEREPDPALMMWIVDVSGTMSLPLPGSQATKWDVERPVLADTVGTLPARFGLGALYFPNMATSASTTSRPTAACVNVNAMIDVGMLGTDVSVQRMTLARSLGATEAGLQEGAPTIDAYLAGLEELGRSPLDGTRRMLLITDGDPTFSEGCVGYGLAEAPVDPTPLIDAISGARRAGIRTFVIGSPGSKSTNSR